VAKQNTNKRLRDKGGLAAFFLAAALSVTPTNLTTPAAAQEVASHTQNQTLIDFVQHQAQNAAKNWKACKINSAEQSLPLQGLLSQQLSGINNSAVQDILSYIADNDLSFCQVDSPSMANKYNGKGRMYSVLLQEDYRLNALNMLHLALEHKFGRFMRSEDFKDWDYESQFIYALSV
jgi:hypothetical protein